MNTHPQADLAFGLNFCKRPKGWGKGGVLVLFIFRVSSMKHPKVFDFEGLWNNFKTLHATWSLYVTFHKDEEEGCDWNLFPSPFVPDLACLVFGKVEEDEDEQEELIQHPSPLLLPLDLCLILEKSAKKMSRKWEILGKEEVRRRWKDSFKVGSIFGTSAENIFLSVVFLFFSL